MTSIATVRPRPSSSVNEGPALTRFVAGPTRASGVEEASDLTTLPGGRLLVVSDKDDRAGVLWPDGRVSSVKLPKLEDGKSQLEGAAYDPVKQRLFVVREEAGELLRYAWDGTGKPKLERTFFLGKNRDENKGVEGLAYLPKEHSPRGQASLLLVHEGRPRELGLLDDSGKGDVEPVELVGGAADVLQDYSCISVDPLTGHVFIGSDESKAISEVVLEKKGSKLVARLVQAFPVPKAKRIEGLTFDEQGNLHVLTENDGLVRTFHRQGAR